MIVANYETKIDEIHAYIEKLQKSIELMKKFLNSYSKESSAHFNQEELRSAQKSNNSLAKLISNQGELQSLVIL